MRPRSFRRRAWFELSLPCISLFCLSGAALAEGADRPKEDEESLSYWAEGEPRLFVSGRVEAGLYAKPQIAVGYGLPHWANVSAEAYGISTTSFAAGYTGIRGYIPFVDLRIGARYTLPFYRSFLNRKDHYDSSDVSDPHGPLGRYLSLETELSLTLPLLGGYLFPV